MKLTPTQAAHRWKKSKTTLYNLMGSGKLSYEVVSKGKREKRLIDVSELVRVFGPEDEQDLPENDKKVTYPQDQVSILLTERINDMKSELDYIKQQLEDQKNTYEARIKWLERQLERKEAEALESIKEVNVNMVKLLEHKNDITAISREHEVVATQEKPQEPPQEPDKPIEPPTVGQKKKRGVLFRMLEAALD